MKRDKKSRTKKKQRRRLMIESLESRQLLAVDGIRIDLSSNGGTDLLGPNGGGSIQEGYLNGPIGLTLNTSNVPGQNNELPVAGPDSHVMGQNDPAVEFLFATLISNDSDPDSADPLMITGIDASDTLGNVTFDEANSKVIYDPNGQLDFVADGQTGTDTFSYTVTDAKGGTGTGIVTITINGVNDAPLISGGPDTSNLTETNSGLTDSGTLNIADADVTNLVTAAVDSVVVSGTGSVPGSLTSANLQSFLSVTPTTILDSTETSDILTWNFNSGC